MTNDKIIKGQIMYYLYEHRGKQCISEVKIRTVTDKYFVGQLLDDCQALLFTYDNLDRVVFRDRETALSYTEGEPK